MTTCERCGRPDCNRMDGSPLYSGTRECDVVASAHQRGLRDGVAMAMEHARPSTCDRCATPPPYGTIEWERASCSECGQEIDWTDVDAELARRGE